MDITNSVQVLTQQAAMAPEYALAVAAIALLIFCASILFKARAAEQLRQTGERHDHLQMGYFNPAKEIFVRRPAELDEDDRTPMASMRVSHPWRSRA
jgi:hypothetical protein